MCQGFTQSQVEEGRTRSKEIEFLLSVFSGTFIKHKEIPYLTIRSFPDCYYELNLAPSALAEPGWSLFPQASDPDYELNIQ